MRKVLILLAFCPLFVTAQDWSLVWSDEFDGTELDITNWTYDLGTGAQFGLNGWGNNELQYYTSNETNVFVEDGMLHIRALEQSLGGMNYTSGRIKSLNKQYWTYGKMEARMKLPTGQGLWPAFWMLPEGQFWPGEIDIMEIVGNEPSILHGTTHQGTVGDVLSIGGSYDAGASLADDFHTYAIVWYPDNIEWYFDDILYFSLERSQVPPQYEWLFAQDYYFLLNVAVGGNWPGAPDATTSFPQEMQVDYVRVYEYAPETNPVTFTLDLSEENVNAGDVPYLNGSFNSWCGTCSPMVNQGNGIWTTTINLPPGIHEYKYVINGWDGTVEGFTSGAPCTITTYDGINTYVNRFVNHGFEPTSIPPVCFNSCTFCPSNNNEGCTDINASNYDANATSDNGSCLYATTFRVDMSQMGLSPSDQVHLNGTFNSWCGVCNQLSDPDEDNIYEITLDLPVGNHEYKFTTNGWSGAIEYFPVGTSCTATTYGNDEVFTNRITQQMGAPLILDVVCFNSCAACVATEITVTFQVDAFDIDASTMDVEIASPFFTGLVPMTQQGWGIWATDVTLNGGETMQYRFVGDGVNESPSGSCVVGGMRELALPLTDLTIPVSCFASCDPCSGCNDPFGANFNPYATHDPNLCVGELLYGCTYADADNYNALATVDDGSCLFDTATCVEDINGDQVVNAADLLAFLAGFGQICN
ncbi:family 16 glycosylhydrolase [Sanyastnella coralliicola]|uniref:family 16 glycosylhydrolase n=1 Tax=Sanyastnella coralliicola TaxID=3069118 RepID=UPI0027B948B4|nr:family 16 glycosylhydrolase [Longitalea sp. SCSIO 12813]